MNEATSAARAGAAESLPPHLQFDQTSENVIEAVDDKRYRAIVFVGDVLTQAIKQSQMYRLGGRLFPHILTVPFKFAARCAITPLHEAYTSVSASLVSPPERQNYIPKYTIKNALLNPATGKRGDIVVGGKGTPSSHLLFKKVFPASEIGTIAYRNDGVVEILALERPQDVLDAQYHFFPDWNRIVTGAVQLPTRLAQLREYLAERTAKTMSPAMRAVGAAYDQSCDQYAVWGKDYIDQQTAIIQGAKQFPGVVQRYDEVAERLFIALELTRQDNLIQDFARNQNAADERGAKIENALEMMAQILANQQGINIGDTKSNEPVIPTHLPDLSAEQAYNESVLGQSVVEEDDDSDGDHKTDDAESEGIVLDDSETEEAEALTEEELAIGKCSEENAEGKPCGMKPSRRIDGKLYCRYHPKTPPTSPPATTDTKTQQEG